MRSVYRYRHPAPPGAIIVRIVEAGGEPFGFVREVTSPDDADDTYPIEQRPIEDVWRLVDNMLKPNPEAPVFMEVETRIDWRPEWGDLL